MRLRVSRKHLSRNFALPKKSSPYLATSRRRSSRVTAFRISISATALVGFLRCALRFGVHTQAHQALGIARTVVPGSSEVVRVAGQVAMPTLQRARRTSPFGLSRRRLLCISAGFLEILHSRAIELAAFRSAEKVETRRVTDSGQATFAAGEGSEHCHASLTICDACTSLARERMPALRCRALA